MWQNLKKTSIGSWRFGKRIFKTLTRASAVERKPVLPVDPNFEKDEANAAGTLVNHDMLIPDPFSHTCQLSRIQKESPCLPYG